MMTAITVEQNGEIVFVDSAISFSNATVYVNLLDTSRADAPSSKIAEQVLRNVRYDSNSHHNITFHLKAIIDEPKGRYTVSVHVDINNNGRVDKGDFINMQSYPVVVRNKRRCRSACCQGKG